MSFKMLLCKLVPTAARAGVSAPAAGGSAPSQACRLAGLALGRSAATSSACLQHGLNRGFGTCRAVLSELLPVLREESEYEQQNYQRPTEAESPPGPWKLIDKPASSHLTLTRTYNNEEIRLEVSANDQPESEEPAEALEEATPEELDQAALDDVGIVFNVHVTKGDQSLVFECRSDGSYVQIEHVSLEPVSGDVDDDHYGGPVFSELDDKVQAQFNNYLAERQVNNEVGEYLLALVQDKEQREYMAWLDRVSSFVGE